MKGHVSCLVIALSVWSDVANEKLLCLIKSRTCGWIHGRLLFAFFPQNNIQFKTCLICPTTQTWENFVGLMSNYQLLFAGLIWIKTDSLTSEGVFLIPLCLLSSGRSKWIQHSSKSLATVIMEGARGLDKLILLHACG